MAGEPEDEWARFLADPRTIRRGDTWFSTAPPPGVPAPPTRTQLEKASDWLEARGVTPEVTALGDEYLVDLIRHSDGHRLVSAATGATPEEAVEAAVRWWQRRFRSG